MVSITELSETDGHHLIDRLELAAPLIGSCLLENMEKIMEASRLSAHLPDAGVNYVKLHHYALVSSIVDTLGVLAANDFAVEMDEMFRLALDNVKANLSLGSFNHILSTPLLSSMHGQDVLLFRAIENESLHEGISFFDYRQVRLQLANTLLNDLSNAAEFDGSGSTVSQLPSCFGNLLVDLPSLKKVDLSFCAINAQCSTEAQRFFVSAFERFMKNLPSNVYHCHEGKTIYSNKGFSLACHCGQSHPIDQCDAICDGGHAHFAVFRSPCGTTINKVVSEGFFRVKGIKIVSTITAEKPLIEVVEQAISSRKRTE